MDYTPEELEDLTRMHDLLARLKGCADARVEAMERMKIAETPLEMQRQVRAIKATADLVVSLYTPKRKPRPAAARPARAPSGDASITRELQEISRLLDARPKTPSPAFAAPEPAPNPPPRTEPYREQTFAEISANTQVDLLTHRCAKAAGIWPDGALFQEGESRWHLHARTAPMTIARGTSEAAIAAMVDAEKLNRANAVARAYGRRTGYDLNGRPWQDGDPDFYVVSANRALGLSQRADGEIPAAQGVPWWIVHVPRDAPG